MRTGRKPDAAWARAVRDLVDRDVRRDGLDRDARRDAEWADLDAHERDLPFQDPSPSAVSTRSCSRFSRSFTTAGTLTGTIDAAICSPSDAGYSGLCVP
jgi:hypothetical protein